MNYFVGIWCSGIALVNGKWTRENDQLNFNFVYGVIVHCSMTVE